MNNYHKEIVGTIKGLGGDETALDGSGRKKLWSLLKTKCPKIKSTFPVGKKDRKGNWCERSACARTVSVRG